MKNLDSRTFTAGPDHARLCFLCVLLSHVTFCCSAVQQAWVARYASGPGSTNPPVGMGVDKDGNIYVAGASTRATPPHDLDYLVIKYSLLGSQLWANRFGAEGTHEIVRSMVVSTNGDVFVTGTTNTVKYYASGLLAWTAPYAGRDITVDSNGNCYVTGFSNTEFATAKLDAQGSNMWVRTWNFDPRSGYSEVLALDDFGNAVVGGVAITECDRYSCYYNFRAVKYNANGDELWRKVILGQFLALVKYEGFACNDLGDFYIAVKYIFGAPSAWSSVKYSSEGEWLWGAPFSDTLGIEGLTDMVLDRDSNVYYTGILRSSYQTYKLTRDGTNIWAANYRPGNIGYHRANGIAADAEGNAYITGQSDLGTGGASDYATVKYSTNGTLLWVKRFTEAGISDDQAHAIALGPNGEVYVTGFSNPTNGLYEITTIKYIQIAPIEKKSDGAILLSFCGTPGSNYTIQACQTLTNWTNIGAATANPSGIYTFEDTNAPAHPQRFYRALEQ